MRRSVRKCIADLCCVALLVLPVTTAKAQTYELLDERGTWKLYRADDVPMKVKGRDSDRYDGLCVAQSTVAGITLQFIMLPAELHKIEEETGFVASVHIFGDEWDFKQRDAFAALTVESWSIGNKRARYAGDLISFDILEFEPFGIFMMFAGVRDEIVVLDRKKKPIARFPTSGFIEIRDKLFSCAGV